MRPDYLDLQDSELELSLLDRVAVVERACLALVAATILVDAAERLIPLHIDLFSGGWTSVGLGAGWIAGVYTAALYFASTHKGPVRTMSSVLVLLAGLGSAAALLGRLLYRVPRAGAHLAVPSGVWSIFRESMPLQASLAFALLAAAILLLQTGKHALVWTEDVLICILLALILVLDSSQIIRSLHLFGITAAPDLPPMTLVCLTLLTTVVCARQATRGLFSVFLGRGSGSSFARALAPFLLAMPFVREGVRAHAISTGWIPPHYMTAVLATFAAAVSLAVLIYLGRRFNAMEAEIQDLSLRDELTALYNLRGFRLLAGQSHLMARRSMQPFSVLYVDLDGLKRINDELGHQAGSDFLVAAAEILKAGFRETDVLARIGGDEFAVAGLLSRRAVIEAVARLEESAARHRLTASSGIPLSFSIGHITSNFVHQESLEELLARADEAMYQEKRRRKTHLHHVSSRRTSHMIPAASSNEHGSH